MLVKSNTLLLSGGADRSVQPRRDTVELARGAVRQHRVTNAKTTLSDVSIPEL